MTINHERKIITKTNNDMGTVFQAKFNINKEYLVNTSLQNNTHNAFRVKQTKQKLPKK